MRTKSYSGSADETPPHLHLPAKLPEMYNWQLLQVDYLPNFPQFINRCYSGIT